MTSYPDDGYFSINLPHTTRLNF
uniref:Uncharacterized protein n=1 Tax=Anguilla anguilla TaxID=7936 RepID=A0A0E9PQF1_ANGAN